MSLDHGHTMMDVYLSPSLSHLDIFLSMNISHATRTNIVRAYDLVLRLCTSIPRNDSNNRDIFQQLWSQSLEPHALAWYAEDTGRWPFAREDVWNELQYASTELLQDEANGLALNAEVEFMGLRWEYRSVYVLRSLCMGHHTAFVKQFAAEQPRYHDRPSDADEALDADGEDFPAFTNLLLLPLQYGDDITVECAIALTAHHIAYACDLFAKTEYDPTDEAIQALMEWRVHQVSSMISDPMGRMPLGIRKHCAGMNVRGMQDFAVQKGWEFLEGGPDAYLNWQMYTWFVECLQEVLKEKPVLLSQVLKDHCLTDVAAPDATPVAHFSPGAYGRLGIPDELVDRWQSYSTDTLEDVPFEAIGPIIDVHDIADITVAPDPMTCTFCLEDFAKERPAPDVFEVSCGHSFHGICLSTMVNGIEPSSNRCPLCRKTICAARERRLTGAYSEASDAEESSSESD